MSDAIKMPEQQIGNFHFQCLNSNPEVFVFSCDSTKIKLSPDNSFPPWIEGRHIADDETDFITAVHELRERFGDWWEEQKTKHPEQTSLPFPNTFAQGGTLNAIFSTNELEFAGYHLSKPQVDAGGGVAIRLSYWDSKRERFTGFVAIVYNWYSIDSDMRPNTWMYELYHGHRLDEKQHRIIGHILNLLTAYDAQRPI